LNQFFKICITWGVDFGNNFLLEGNDEMEEMEPKKKDFGLFFLLLIIFSYVVQHLQYATKMNLKDGKEPRV
jgi:hypothetical protein